MTNAQTLPDGGSLSVAAKSVWAKSDVKTGEWLPLHRHMADSAAVAGLLWDRWLPGSLRRTMSDGLADADGRSLAMWLAAVHDLGKATPAFAVQVRRLAEQMNRAGLTMRPSMPPTERRRAPHSVASHVLLRRWLVESERYDRNSASTYAIVLGGHHGVTPSISTVADADQPHLLGTGQWCSVQAELADYAADVARASSLISGRRSNSLRPVAQVLLTGLVIVADWIASDVDRFPYHDLRSSAERGSAAWEGLGLTPPWTPRIDKTLPIDRLFRERFRLADGAVVRPVQRCAVEVAARVSNPGLLIIEAPMGEGKTEAALAAAETLAARTGAGGCFVALPTMATSDAMFARVLEWIDRLPGDGAVSTYLAHGKAALNNDFRQLAFRGRPNGVGVDEMPEENGASSSTAVALQWLSGRKKGVLSSFVVGTIDQILVGALRSRHLVLRHLALAGKVVIIDEVHAADEYMSVYLDRILMWLGAYRVPTVLLSATLPGERRSGMVAAYQQGRDGGSNSQTGQSTGLRARRKSPALAAAPKATPGSPAGYVGYPVVVATTDEGALVVAAEPSGRRRHVATESAADDDPTLVALLQVALRDGGCVGIIRNTVGRAQSTARLLREHYGDDVVLVHSRFLAVDRIAREAELRRQLGPPGSGVHRPPRLVVVGTQVLEQSLDIDFDLLVTDLAPIDLLLQRMGRLHRHDRASAARPEPVRRPRCVVVGVLDWTVTPPIPVGVSELIYPRALLLRALAVLAEHWAADTSLRLPDEIAPLVQQAYAADLAVPATWGDALSAAQKAHEADVAARQRAAENFRLDPVPGDGHPIYGWNSRGVGDAEDSVTGQAQVRDGDETIEVIVVQKRGPDYFVPEWVPVAGGRQLGTIGEPDRAVARAAAGCTVRLPAQLSAPWRIDALISALEANGVAAWQESPWLKGQLVLALDEKLHAELPGAALTYDRLDGLIVTPTPAGNP